MRLRDMLKATPRTIKTSPRSLYEKHHERMVEGISAFLSAQGKVIIPHVVKKFGKAEKTQIGLLRKVTPEELADSIKLEGWEDMVSETMQPDIMSAFNDAGAFASAKTIAAGSTVEMEALTSMVNKRAVEYAATRSAELVTLIEDSTRNMIRDAVSASLTDGLGSYGLADKLAPIFGNVRADLIASYELGQSAVTGNVEAWEASGVVKGKEWITAGDVIVSDGCAMNAAQGVIAIDKPFQSGHMHPLAHPHCRCDVVAEVGKVDKPKES